MVIYDEIFRCYQSTVKYHLVLRRRDNRTHLCPNGYSLQYLLVQLVSWNWIRNHRTICCHRSEVELPSKNEPQFFSCKIWEEAFHTKCKRHQYIDVLYCCPPHWQWNLVSPRSHRWILLQSPHLQRVREIIHWD